MRNVIVGTAGHVDHGKTCLIQALTGIHTDRLKEEQKRGITIELGFANIPNEEGLHIGVIDVPGHEKFVKNMLAGIGGIDIVLLVVALDEGVMPQTIEHFEILKMLQIPRGMIVLTKADLVDMDWADLVEEDVRELVKGSFLETAECIRVSSYTGQNIDVLRERILMLARMAEARREEPELFRLPVDRVFAMEGVGTVVTGTLLEGSVEVGEEVMIYPDGLRAKVRGLQSHNEKEERAAAGQRTALNLVGPARAALARGQVLARPGTLRKSPFLDGVVSLFSCTKRKLKNGSRVHVNIGAAQVTAKAVLLDADEIGAGESACVQFRFDSPIAVRKGDRFMIRFFSPVETFGGGVITDPTPPKRKRYQEEILREFAVRENGSEEEILALCLKRESFCFPDSAELALSLHETRVRTEELLEHLKKKKQAIQLRNGRWFDRAAWEQVAEAAKELLETYHRENPIAPGMDKEEFKNRLFGKFWLKDTRQGELFLDELMKRKIAAVNGNTVAFVGFQADYTAAHTEIRNRLLAMYQEAGVQAPDTSAILKQFSDQRQAKQVLRDLVKDGTLRKLNPGAFLLTEEYERAVSLLFRYFETHETMPLGDFRDLLGTSRKYVLALLEHFDRIQLTKLEGDVRILIKKPE